MSRPRSVRIFVAASVIALRAAILSPALLLSAGLAIAQASTPPPASPALSTPPAANLPPGMVFVTAVEGIEEYHMENGLRLLLFPEPSKQTMTVNITYLVGSRHENYGESGMAHLLEHLMFKGSERHTNIPQELTSHGARPNGSTWFDRTNYFETFAASEANLTWALDLEADRMVKSFIAQKDLDSEMTVVRNEFEVGENNPREVGMDRTFSAAYLWHNYGKSTIGARSDLEHVPIDKLQAFYRTWYQPDNAVLVVGGKLDRARTLALVAETFGAIPRPSRMLPVLYTEEPAQDGEREVTLHRVGDTQQVGIAYHTPAGSHPDFAPVEVLARILGDTPSGRLYKSLVETGKASSVSAEAFQLHDPGMAWFSVELGKGKDIGDARDTAIRVLESVAAEPPTPEEVTRARESLLADWESGMRNSERAAVGLSEWAAMGDWRLIFLHRDRLRTVTPSDVQRVASAYLVSANRTVGLYIPVEKPERVEIPQAATPAEQLAAYAGGQGMSQGEEFDASPAAIEARLTRSTLPSGLKLVLLPKKTRAATVNVNLRLHFGDEKSLRGLATVGELTASMLDRGTTRHTRQQLKDEFDRLRARIRLFGDPTGVTASVEMPRESLESALTLVAEMLREPAFPDSELAQLQREEITGLEEGMKDPGQIARTTLERHLRPFPRDDVRYVFSPEEQITATKAVTRSQVADFHRSFYGASAGEMAFVGDFDPAKTRDLLGRLFGDWKSAKPYQRLVDTYQVRPAIDQRIETPDKESAVFNAGLRIPLRDDDAAYPAMTLGNFMTGGGFLNSRLATRIRQKEGMSYSVRSFFFADSKDRTAEFGAFAICAPQNAGRLVTAFREELQKIRDVGFADTEIEEAKSGWLQQRQVQRSGERELAQTLAQREEQERTLAWDTELERRVGDLTPAELQAAIKKYVDPKKVSVVVAGDFAGAKRKAAEGDKPAAGGKPGEAGRTGEGVAPSSGSGSPDHGETRPGR
jgi:zinc protease